MNYFLNLLQEMTQSYMSRVESMMYSEQTDIVGADEIDRACEVSPALEAIDVNEHYLQLWQKLVCEEPAKSTAEPLKHFKLSIDDQGLLALDTEHYHEQVQYSEREAMRIAGAILQLCIRIPPPATDGPAGKARYLDFGIGYFLMRPFIKAFPFSSVQQIGARFRQYLFHCRRKLSYAQTKNDNAVLLQRQWRKKRYTQKRPERIDPASVVFDDKVSTHIQKLILSPQCPKERTVMSGSDKRAWINANREGPLADSVEDIADSIYFRSHAKFMLRLEQSVEKFNEFIYSMPKYKRNFIIVLPDIDYPKSNHWVTGLALPFLRKQPVAITTVSGVKSLPETKKIAHLVYIDDAIYSGKQLEQFCREIRLGLCVIAPFYTQRALSRIDIHVPFFRSERMLAPEEVHGCKWRESDSAKRLNRTLEEVAVPLGQYRYDATMRVGVFFQHKRADQTSTFLDQTIEQQAGGDSKFLPRNIGKPY